MFKTLNIFILGLCVVSVVGLTSCQTVEGAGEDIENVGETIQDAAK